MHTRQTHDLAPNDVKLWQGMGKADRFGQTMFRQTARLVGADVGVQRIGARFRDRCRTVAVLAPLEEREIVVIFGRV
jgi:hypothetical protein